MEESIELSLKIRPNPFPNISSCKSQNLYSKKNCTFTPKELCIQHYEPHVHYLNTFHMHMAKSKQRKDKIAILYVIYAPTESNDVDF